MRIFRTARTRALGAAAAVLAAAVASAAFAGTYDPAAEADTLIRKGVEAHAKIQDYGAYMHREVVLPTGNLLILEMYLRYDKPRTIFMKYLDGPKAGLEVLYSEGNFDGKIMCRPPGALFEFIPIVGLSPDDKRIKSQESRPIYNAGIGYMIEQFAEDWEEAKAAGQAEVVSIMPDEVAVYSKYASESVRAKRVEILFKSPDREYPRMVMYFRESDGLPVQLQMFKEGEAAPNETYAYYAIKLEPAKDDPDFVKNIDRRLLGYYLKT